MLHGRLIRDQRKFPEAAAEFERATKLKPDAPQAWSELAGVLVMAENYPPALAALDRIAALHAEKPGHVFLRAIVLDKIRDLKPALESYQRFLANEPGRKSEPGMAGQAADQDLAKGDQQEMISALLICFAFSGILAFADMAAMKSEPDLNRRSELALMNADEKIDAARQAYQAGNEAAQQAAIQEVADSVARLLCRRWNKPAASRARANTTNAPN